MIELTRLRLKNFLSHVDTDIPLQEYHGLTLIEGITTDGHYSSNGAGKSTILEGIIYAITGDTLRGVSVNDVVNRNYKKNTNVSLYFTKDSEEYIISRYRKDDEYGDSLFLMKNNKDISKRVNKETQKLIEDVLGISYKLLVSTVLLGEGLSSRFTQLSDPEKKSLIESTLNLDYDMNKIRDRANDKLKSMKTSSDKLEGELNILSKYLEVNIDSLNANITDQEKSLHIYEETTVHLNREYERLMKDISTITPKIDVIKNTLNEYASLNREYERLTSQNMNYQSELENLINGKVPDCPLCHQKLQSDESRKSIEDNYRDNIDSTNTLINSVKANIEKLPDISTLEQKLESLDNEYREKSQQSRDLMRDYNSYSIKVAETKKDISSSREIISSAEDTKNQKEIKEQEKKDVLKQVTKYDYFYKLFSPTGIIINILSDAVSYINDRLSAYSDVLLEKEYRINFVKGKISLIDEKGSSYQSLSNGEKRRLDISIQFALHDYVHMYCGMKLDCCFIDEILDTLDSIGVDNIFEVLRLKLEYCNLKSIYVITHNNSLKDKFDRIITISKNAKNDSYLL